MMKSLIDAAICRKQCDIVLKNAFYTDVFSGQILKGDIGVLGDTIVGVGSYSGKEEYDLSGKYVLPGFIDAHVHIESSQLSPQGFASLVVPRGTTTVIADPHEIVNVCGEKGAKYMAEAAALTPLSVKLMLPSCVPATPFETSGAEVGAEAVERLLPRREFFGLGEFMNVPAVLEGDGEAIAKLSAAQSLGKPADGHAPELKGNALNAYLCAGIVTDHECETVAEIKEKISKGTFVMLRHGSSARNILKNYRAVTPSNYGRFLICTDDRHAADIAEKGHIDDALRVLVERGIKPVRAVTMATFNAARCYKLERLGAIAPNYIADLAVVDDLKSFNVIMTFKGGKLVAKGGKPLFTAQPANTDGVKSTVKIPKITPESFKMPFSGTRAKAIKIRESSIVTDCIAVPVQTEKGEIVVKGTNLLKAAVIERHGKNGNIGRGLVTDYGFRGGAMALTIAHDSHNMLVLGDDDNCMAEAANKLAEAGGGMIIVQTTGKTHSVPLEIGGIMTAASPEKYIEESKALFDIAYKMGVKKCYDPFLSLAFISLAVIPHLKLLDGGLFDVDKFAFTTY